MPKAAKRKTVAPVAPTPPAPVVSTANELPVVYPVLEVDVYSTTSPKGPLEVEWMKKAMGWETEPEYQARMVREKGGAAAHYIFGDLGIRYEDGSVSPVHCVNVAGEKVVCRHNAHNRSFDKEWCEDLVHTILYGQWAGPHTMPGQTINGETIRISCYGRVLSGQHQMTAAILADEYLHRKRADLGMDAANAMYPAWAKHNRCFIETIVVKGMSEDPRVLMTIDYVKPRTAADVFYTSDVFKACLPVERKELCRMLASAVDLLWTRTATKGYRTHPEIVGFLDRHKKLLDCVLHLFTENKPTDGRKISKLYLQSGTCSTLMYLMGCGATTEADSDAYRNMEPPTEKELDWSLWQKASEFWTLLANGRDFMPVRTALSRLRDSDVNSEENQGLGGRWPEKLAVLAKAWERWKDCPAGAPFDDDDLVDGGLLSLSYSDLDAKGNKLPDGEITLIDIADFYGIDCPTVVKGKAARSGSPEPPPPTPEEMGRLYEANRLRHGLPPST